VILLRGLLFTLFVPCVVGGCVPYLMWRDSSPFSGLWNAGWLLVVLGAAIYSWCLFAFLTAGGTPAIFFTRHLRSVLGEEPTKVVRNGLYRFSRNPMYAGVLLAVFGQALVFRSAGVAWYGVGLGVCFHFVVVVLEEPHLRRERGSSYDDYCRRVPRWVFGRF
jgi:protein-S-isoprenylcysteine O-methyltransferase Ste14